MDIVNLLVFCYVVCLCWWWLGGLVWFDVVFVAGDLVVVYGCLL